MYKVLKFGYLYWKWADHHAFARFVHNSLPGNTAVRDTILTYTAVDLKSCHILNIWLVEAQVGIRQAIHHGIVSKDNFKQITAIRPKIMLLLTLQVRSDIIAIQRTEYDTKTYELSLFGVMVVLTLVRLRERGRLKHDLYYRDIRFSEYYNKIAANYAHKLRLIFEKWDILKRVLGSYSAYNFDIIIDKDVRYNGA